MAVSERLGWLKGLEKDVDERVLDSMKSSKWAPAMKNCKPVESDLNFEVSLNIG